MKQINTLLEGNYRCHPAFNLALPSWNAPTEKLAAFNDIYAAAQELGVTLDTSSRQDIRQDLEQLLSDIFRTFEAQTDDAYETRFLLELKNACLRLIGEELVWYARQPRTRFVSLSDKQIRQDAIRLQQNRHYFGCLPAPAVAEMRKLAESALAQCRANAAAGRLRREDLSINAGPTVRAIRNVLNREFKALGVLDAVSAYTGCKIRVTGLALELSVPQATWWKNTIANLERPPRTLYAHLDETISCPKAIVYLSDVTEQNGPTSCYPGAYEAMQLNPLQEIIGRIVGTVGSQSDSPLKEYYAKQYHQSVNSENFRRHFMRLPACLRFNSHMGWDVMPDSELESTLMADEIKMTGPAGTFITFDGARLLHRGGLMQEGERVALQVIFSNSTFTERAVNKLKRML
ncbi:MULTISPECIES: hypothetical protein [unclassified Herbaspirillum]|uniref:hypothetical protein n=1 Tax=unclassified Herbaspirillum TaxID=2624150 RepID=UPI0011528573|nr:MULTISPECIES: hypothetical protein [unclassified Herbaspirillum]MBB5392538.1 hypothetical protein [Herbaspirillum sp. SJZ102]TQK06175.1 hypothetical protein FB599_2321 [Herbaspirillum sp. SJZ130]TQK12347.1 hypothetical protein FB598_2299 [Herbaspirillum sp. SJZ106]